MIKYKIKPLQNYCLTQVLLLNILKKNKYVYIKKNGKAIQQNCDYKLQLIIFMLDASCIVI